MITYHQLQTFLTVVRTGSVTKAARELHATQPTVSLQMHALRQFLGTSLYERPGGTFKLTPGGEELRRYAEEALGGLRALQQNIGGLQGKLAGPLAVGATFAMSRYVLGTVLSQFREQYPDVDLRLHVGLPEQLFAGLTSNFLDVACYISVRTPPEFALETLGQAELLVVASPRHPLAGRRRVKAKDLSAHPIVVPVSSPLRELIDTKLRLAGVTPRIAAEGRHHDAIKRLVERNAGYSLLIKPTVADELAKGRLVTLPLHGPPMLAELVVAVRPRPKISPLVREFIEFVRGELPGQP